VLASKVMFAPQLRATFRGARSPRRDHPYMGASEVLVPISSTNTRRLESISSVTITRQAALSHSSLARSHPPLFFRLHPIRLSILLTVESLTLTPATRLRNSCRCGRVAAGRFSRSA
jgi:hypothetical protein